MMIMIKIIAMMMILDDVNDGYDGDDDYNKYDGKIMMIYILDKDYTDLFRGINYFLLLLS